MNIKNFDKQQSMKSSMRQKAWNTAPHVTFMYEPDVTDIIEELDKLNEKRAKNKKVSFDTLVLKLISEGLKASPIMNSKINYSHALVGGKIEMTKKKNKVQVMRLWE